MSTSSMKPLTPHSIGFLLILAFAVLSTGSFHGAAFIFLALGVLYPMFFMTP